MNQRESKKILQRLAEYHHAKLVFHPEYICFKFKCGNEYISWDKTSFFDDEKCWVALEGSEKINNATGFLNNYIQRIMFDHKLNDDISRDFIDFKLKMLKANTVSELKLRLDIMGF